MEKSWAEMDKISLFSGIIIAVIFDILLLLFWQAKNCMVKSEKKGFWAFHKTTGEKIFRLYNWSSKPIFVNKSDNFCHNFIGAL